MNSVYKILLFIVLMCIDSFAKDELKFCLYTSDKPSDMIKMFKPITTYLENEINKEVNIKIYPDYDVAIKAIANNDCDFARTGPASYILANDINSAIKVIAMEHKKGETFFNGVFIVPSNSTITKLTDFKNKSFAFGNDQSTIGRYLAQEQFVNAGIYAKDLKSYKYLGRHDIVANAVALGKYDGGVVKESTFKKFENKGIKKIATFKNVTKPWVASESLSKEDFLSLKNALLKLKDKDTLKNLKIDGFLPSFDTEYDFVRDGMKKSLFF